MMTAQAVRIGRDTKPAAFTRPSLTFDSYCGLLRTLASQGHRPNLLVAVGQGMSTDATARRVMTLGVLPFHWCALPGQLILPPRKRGTLFLNDVGALSRAQQLTLYDWLSAECEELQAVSITSVPLESMVEDGQFLEALYYRLNVVRLDVTRHG